MAEHHRRKGKDIASEEIKRLWGDIPVVDGKENLRVFIMPEDVGKATPKDPGCCVFAQACKRSFGATKVLFFRTVAYVEIPQPDGSRLVERFLMSPEMRRLVENFDRGETIIPHAGFVLKKPNKSKMLEAARRCHIESDKRRKLAGTYTKKKDRKPRGYEKGKFQDAPLVVDMDVRSGSGAVHFT